MKLMVFTYSSFFCVLVVLAAVVLVGFSQRIMLISYWFAFMAQGSIRGMHAVFHALICQHSFDLIFNLCCKFMKTNNICKVLCEGNSFVFVAVLIIAFKKRQHIRNTLHLAASLGIKLFLSNVFWYYHTSFHWGMLEERPYETSFYLFFFFLSESYWSPCLLWSMHPLTEDPWGKLSEHC